MLDWSLKIIYDLIAHMQHVYGLFAS